MGGYRRAGTGDRLLRSTFRSITPSAPTAGPPVNGSLRQFTVCANAASCSVPTDFKTVGARVRAVGAHVAIYVDTLAPSPGLDSADIDTLRQVFDTLLYPLDTANFGGVSDLDTNGVVRWLNPAAERLLGNVRGRHFTGVVGPNPNAIRPGMVLQIPPLASFTPAQLQDAKRRFPSWRNY